MQIKLCYPTGNARVSDNNVIYKSQMICCCGVSVQCVIGHYQTRMYRIYLGKDMNVMINILSSQYIFISHFHTEKKDDILYLVHNESSYKKVKRGAWNTNIATDVFL